MFPIPARVLFPALVSLLSALWAAAEWRAARAAELVAEPDLDAIGEAHEAAEQRRAAADERAERKLRLAEAREARLAGRELPGGPAAAADGASTPAAPRPARAGRRQGEPSAD